VRVQRFVRPIWYLGNNRVSQIGVMLTTASAVTLLTFFTTTFFGVTLGPYAGILAVLVLPGVFVLGLLLIPFGIWLRRRRERRAGTLPADYPPIDLRRADIRETLLFVVLMSGFNVALFLTVTYRAVHYMESVSFCGTTCHTVMQPEFTSHENAAHARVPCVDCHIGPGASWFVRSKLSGSYQLLAVAFDLYPRPIPVPIHNLRPSRDTCEQCHWPESFIGDKLLVKTHYGDEEKTVETKTVLLMHTGGVDRLTGRPMGNHGVHVHEGAEIYYWARDAARQDIPYVRYRRPDGEVVEYVVAPKGKQAPPRPDPQALRLMDCIDCHNRPTHRFQQPGAAVDESLAAGVLDRSLPFIKKVSVEALEATYDSHEAAAAGIRGRLVDFYGKRDPAAFAQQGAAIDAAAATLAGIYARNVFPAMRVGWGSYADNLGHQDFPGCLRCHDGEHTSADGRSIASDCETCHALLALDDPDPEILRKIAGD
jgi:NapC/NirT cytochrome c family, N-terminal region